MADLATRLALVDEHIRCENRHDIAGIMATFGQGARYDEEPWDDHHIGRAAVETYYRSLLGAMPDLTIDVRTRHATETSVILEVVISGHHFGTWRGLLPTGRRVEFPLCGIFSFDDADRLAGEKIYYDRATVLSQLGVFHEPDTLLGQVGTVLLHPLIVGQIAWHGVSRLWTARRS